jgi:hypothetical protein
LRGNDPIVECRGMREEEAKASKARKEQELGGGWCLDVCQYQGRWLARAYRKGEHSRGLKTRHQVLLPQRAAAGRHGSQRHRHHQAVNGSRPGPENRGLLALRYWCRLWPAAPSRLWPESRRILSVGAP